MPVKFGLWRLDGESAKQVRSNAIASEERLEKIIQERLDILGLDDLFQIGRQVITDFGKRIDLLATRRARRSVRHRAQAGSNPA